MNPRERMVAIALLLFITLGAGAFLVYQLYLEPLKERGQRILALQGDINNQMERIDKVNQQKPKMLEARQLSLSSDPTLSGRKYSEFLLRLLNDCRISLNAAPGAFTITPITTADNFRGPKFDSKKGPFLTPLTFRVAGRTDLEHLVDLLQRLYAAPILHRIKTLKVSQPSNLAGSGMKPREPGRSRDLEVDLTVEALIVSGAPARDLTTLVSSPTGQPPTGSPAVSTGSAAPHRLARQPDDYKAILAKNIFYGPPPTPEKPQEGPDIAKSIQLVCITHPGGEDESGCEAILYNHSDNSWTRLCPKLGKETFQFHNSLGELRVQGTVVRIDEQDLVFRVGEDLYQIDMNETLDKALARKPLTESEMRARKLTRGPGNGGAQ
jgi:hypothetical protein